MATNTQIQPISEVMDTASIATRNGEEAYFLIMTLVGGECSADFTLSSSGGEFSASGTVFAKGMASYIDCKASAPAMADRMNEASLHLFKSNGGDKYRLYLRAVGSAKGKAFTTTVTATNGCGLTLVGTQGAVSSFSGVAYGGNVSGFNHIATETNGKPYGEELNARFVEADEYDGMTEPDPDTTFFVFEDAGEEQQALSLGMGGANPLTLGADGDDL